MGIMQFFSVIAFGSILLYVVSASTNCEQDLKVVKEKRFGAIKNQILSKLNMTEAPPNPAQPRALTPEIWDAYYVIDQAFKRDAMSRATGCVDNNYFARKVTLITPEVQEQPSMPLSPTSATTVLREDTNTFYGGSQEGQNLSFSVQLPTGSSNEVDYAEIRLRKDCNPADFPQYSTLCYAYSSQNINLVYANVEIYVHLATSHGTRKAFVAGRSIILNDGKLWEEFMITEALQRCLSEQPYKTMLHLELEIKLDPSDPYAGKIDPYSFFQNSVASLTNTTQLVVFTVNERDVENARRSRRQVTKEFCFANFTTNCCVRNLTINFVEDLNWTWVLAPTEYDPNYCSGGCPYLWPTATLHAETLQTVKFLNPAASAEPCCVPALLMPLTIIREDEDTGGLIFEPLSEMIVESCHCR